VSPRSGFALGLALGLSVVYFVGLIQGLSLGTLLWRSLLGGGALGAFLAVLIYLLGDPFTFEQAQEEETEEGEGTEAGEEAESGEEQQR